MSTPMDSCASLYRSGRTSTKFPMNLLNKFKTVWTIDPEKFLEARRLTKSSLEKKMYRRHQCAFKVCTGRNNELCRAEHLGAARSRWRYSLQVLGALSLRSPAPPTLREYLHLWLLHVPSNSSLPARFPVPTLSSNLTKSNTPLSNHSASFSEQGVALHFWIGDTISNNISSFRL